MYVVQTTILDSLIHGKGYFADQDIPLGTIVYLYGSSDVFYTKQQFMAMNQDEKNRLAEFGVEDEFGSWMLTSTGPYTNHSCDANILSLYVDGIYCDVAVKDIFQGNEITVDYGMFFSSKKWEMDCKCGADACRQKVGFGISVHSDAEQMWFRRLEGAIHVVQKVQQPCFQINDPKAQELREVITTKVGRFTLGKYIKHSLIVE